MWPKKSPKLGPGWTNRSAFDHTWPRCGPSWAHSWPSSANLWRGGRTIVSEGTTRDQQPLTNAARAEVCQRGECMLHPLGETLTPHLCASLLYRPRRDRDGGAIVPSAGFSMPSRCTRRCCVLGRCEVHGVRAWEATLSSIRVQRVQRSSPCVEDHDPSSCSVCASESLQERHARPRAQHLALLGGHSMAITLRAATR